MARRFAGGIEQHPEHYMLSADDAAGITDAVKAFRSALAVSLRPGTRTKLTIMTKDERRAEAERVIRKYAKLIRANEDVSAVDKQRLGVRERPKRAKRRACPQTPPYVRFVRSERGQGGGRGRHVLEFMDEFRVLPALYAGGNFTVSPAGDCSLTKEQGCSVALSSPSFDLNCTA